MTTPSTLIAPHDKAEILAQAPYRIERGVAGKESVRQIREFIWLQMLNRGLQLWATAVADAHFVHGNAAGGWRVYLPSSSDQPAEIDWRENIRNAIKECPPRAKKSSWRPTRGISNNSFQIAASMHSVVPAGGS